MRRHRVSSRLVAAVAPVIGVVGLVVAMAQLPTIHNALFYVADDSAAQFIPTWYHLGELLRSGRFPLLEPSMWAGGNIAAEALFGIWNPVLLGNMALVSTIPDPLVAADLVKTEFLTILALGVYGVAREYHVGRWMSIVPAITVPFAGATLYFDASSWASGLIAFAFVPHFWWTLRRAGRGALSPAFAFVAGYLAVTAGNPYGTLGVGLVVITLITECVVARRWRRLRRVLVGATATGLVVPLVYLPLVLTQPVTYRSGAGISNNGLMVPGLADLLNASTPGFDAYVHAFEAPYLTVPATYMAWYLVPLLPWLRYDRLRRLLPSMAGLLVFTAIAVTLCTGPSDAWMFRWPLRVVPYLVLPVVVLSAVALAQGLARTHVRGRAAASAGLVLAGTYLAVAARPDFWHVHGASLVLEACLATALVLAFLRRPRGSRAPVAVLVGGCVMVLAFQVAAYPRNLNFSGYTVPASFEGTRAALTTRYPGTVLVVADNGIAQHTSRPGDRSDALLFGNLLHAVGVNSVNAYYGMGFQAFSDRLCMAYNGSTCAKALDAIWRPAAPGSPPLADLLRLDTIVIQNDLPGAAAVPIADRWSVAYRDDVVTVLRRSAALAEPNGRLSQAPQGTLVDDDVATDRTEQLNIQHSPGGTLTFARLAWPGYTAALNDTPLPVGRGPAGLLTVDVPPGSRGELTLAWTPPGLGTGLLAAILGALLALGQSVSVGVGAFRRRRSALVRSPLTAPITVSDHVPPERTSAGLIDRTTIPDLRTPTATAPHADSAATADSDDSGKALVQS